MVDLAPSCYQKLIISPQKLDFAPMFFTSAQCCTSAQFILLVEKLGHHSVQNCLLNISWYKLAVFQSKKHLAIPIDLLLCCIPATQTVASQIIVIDRKSVV